jgi:hypothetical protein
MARRKFSKKLIEKIVESGGDRGDLSHRDGRFLSGISFFRITSFWASSSFEFRPFGDRRNNRLFLIFGWIALTVIPGVLLAFSRRRFGWFFCPP